VTDPHLDHLLPEAVTAFFHEIVRAAPDVLLIGGDIAVADTIETFLRQLEALANFPIYFVLGNHDYYNGSIADVRFRMATLTHGARYLRWLSESGVVKITERAGLIGSGGWGDARLGDYANSQVKVNDSVYIEDLAALDDHAMLAKLQELGRNAANHLRFALPEALARFEHILVLMHVPPFAQACWHDGRPGDAHWLPHFACGAAGEVLYEAARDNTYHQFTVLCGHTHSAVDTHLLPNLQIKTGEVVYGHPRIQEILTIP